MKIVVYDLETKNRPVTREQWTDWAWLGISVGCAFDFSTGEYHVFMDDNIGDLAKLLNSADMVAAFNHVAFDNNLLRGVLKAGEMAPGAVSLKIDAELLNYDMLLESRAGARVDTYTKGFKLDEHLLATLGPGAMKTGDGAMAPELFKNGKIGQLVDYCMADVHRERMLFESVWRTGELACAHGRHQVRRPQAMMKIVDTTPLIDDAHQLKLI